MRRVFKTLHVWTAKHLLMSLGNTTFSKLKPQLPLPASVPTKTIPTARVNVALSRMEMALEVALEKLQQIATWNSDHQESEADVDETKGLPLTDHTLKKLFGIKLFPTAVLLGVR